jgi:hypothetical protein
LKFPHTFETVSETGALSARRVDAWASIAVGPKLGREFGVLVAEPAQPLIGSGMVEGPRGVSYLWGNLN